MQVENKLRPQKQIIEKTTVVEDEDSFHSCMGHMDRWSKKGL
jgi:hypothetical protein